MHNLLAERVDLEIAHDNVLGFAIQRQFDQAGMERTFFQRVEHGFVVYGDGNGFLVVAVQNGGYLAGATQAAARTCALCFAEGGLQFV